MRCWLGVTCASVVVAAGLGVVPAPAEAQSCSSSEDVNGEGSFDGGSGTGGRIVGGGAGVTARYCGPGPEDTAHTGGSNVTCEYEMEYFDQFPNEPVNWSELMEPSEELLAAGHVWITRRCDGGWAAGTRTFTMAVPVAGPPQEDPRDLAIVASAQLPFPLPEVEFSPPLDDPDDFLLVNLETWLWVTNWAESTRSATAGPVTASVTATPVRLEWDFTPDRSDPDTEGSCASAGTAFDPDRPLEVQSSECAVTFRHSSAAEPDHAYDGRVSVVYRVVWSSNIGDGGDLGEVRRTVSIPVRVGEQQALNE